MALLETGDGRKLPQHLASELNRLRRRLVLVRELISELDTERDEHLTATSGDAITTKVTALSEIYGVGDNFAAVLAREVFYRQFGNRKQLASYVGLAPMPHQSGNVDKDRRIGRAGNARARKTLVQAAWLWLRYQPKSDLSSWFHRRVGELKGRVRRIAIVAMARKLLIALWRYTEKRNPGWSRFPSSVEITASICWLCEEHDRLPQWSIETAFQVGRAHWGFASCMRHYGQGFHAESDRM